MKKIEFQKEAAQNDEAVDGHTNSVAPDGKPHQSKKSRKGLWISIAVICLLAIGTGIYLLTSGKAFGKEMLDITPEFTKALERYDQIDAFSEGLAAVRRDGKWGYINLKGEEVIPCQFSNDFPPGQFSEGLACVVDDRTEADKKLWNKRVGFINKQGEWVITGDFFTESPNIGSVWAEESHQLPSFKEGKCAVWNTAITSFEDDENLNKATIVLIDRNGKSEEVADSVGYKMANYKPYPIPTPYKDCIGNQERRIVYDDYAITIGRDTVDCDNGAKLVTWQILDANSYPYDTNEKTCQYFVDSNGQSTLTTERKQFMEQHLNGLMSSCLDRHNEQLRREAEEERMRQEEEERQRQREWLYGTWEYNGTIDMGRYLGGVKRVTSRLIITEDNLKCYDNGRLEYNGYYEIEDGQIVYDRHNGSCIALPLDTYSHRIQFDRNGKYYNKVSSSTSGGYSSNSYPSSSNNSSYTNFRTETDVWAYLSSHSFSADGVTIRVSQRYLEINGTPATGAVRVSNIRGSSATLTASSPYQGGQTLTMYLNASNGTINNAGTTFYAR